MPKPAPRSLTVFELAANDRGEVLVLIQPFAADPGRVHYRLDGRDLLLFTETQGAVRLPEIPAQFAAKIGETYELILGEVGAQGVVREHLAHWQGDVR